MYTAVAILYPDALATSITLPMEILHAASQMASVRNRGSSRVRFTLAGPDRKQVKLGIEAPSNIKVHREEIYQKIQDENIRASNIEITDLNELEKLIDKK